MPPSALSQMTVLRQPPLAIASVSVAKQPSQTSSWDLKLSSANGSTLYQYSFSSNRTGPLTPITQSLSGSERTFPPRQVSEGEPFQTEPNSLNSVCVVVPAFNEEHSIQAVIEALHQQLPGARVVVVSDGSTDHTATVAAAAGATVVCLPVNLGIGGAVQAGYRYAVRHGFSYAMQVDGDGQHDVTDAPRLLEPVLTSKADMALGSRWIGRGDYVASKTRRVGMTILAILVRWRTGQAFTDTTSGYRALGPRALHLFASSYPTDFPEVESIVHAKHAGLRIIEVPVRMNSRKHGRSSIAGLRSAYYMARVAFALLLGGPGWAGR